jgi:hypothetical protein
MVLVSTLPGAVVLLADRRHRRAGTPAASGTPTTDDAAGGEVVHSGARGRGAGHG